MKSTMGAPLSDPEIDRILAAWDALERYASTLSVALPLGGSRGEDQVEMLDQATQLVMLVYELRRAISDGWYYANKRAFPDVPKPPKKFTLVSRRGAGTASDFGKALSALDVTEAELDSILEGLRK